ncbi:MAG: rhomboid family intramembrane serine protease [Candidatus Aminicenantaceae bacterium]
MKARPTASLLHMVFNINSRAPMIGASGAIAGILEAYMILYPGARVLTLVFFFFIRTVPIPAAFILGFWFLMQLLNVGVGGGAAWFAHIGGILAGMMLLGWISGKKPKAWM